MTTRDRLIETFPEFTKTARGIVDAAVAAANGLVSESVFKEDHAFAVVALAAHFLSLENVARKHGASGAVLRKLRQASRGDENNTASIEFASPDDSDLSQTAYGRIFRRVQRSRVISVAWGGQ